MAQRKWTVRVAAVVDADFEGIVRWTAGKFGSAQAITYAKIISSAIESLRNGAQTTGVKARDDIAKGLFTLHAARDGHKARHFILFRIGSDGNRSSIEVLRILHDAMDLPQHVPPF